jgi:hypothetical protein
VHVYNWPRSVPKPPSPPCLSTGEVSKGCLVSHGFTLLCDLGCAEPLLHCVGEFCPSVLLGHLAVIKTAGRSWCIRTKVGLGCASSCLCSDCEILPERCELPGFMKPSSAIQEVQRATKRRRVTAEPVAAQRPGSRADAAALGASEVHLLAPASMKSGASRGKAGDDEACSDTESTADSDGDEEDALEYGSSAVLVTGAPRAHSSLRRLPYRCFPFFFSSSRDAPTCTDAVCANGNICTCHIWSSLYRR